MKNNILTLAITLTVGIILAGSLLMPVINDATDTEDTFTNEGLWRLKTIEDGDVWTYTNSSQTWTLNGDEIPNISSTGWNTLLGDSWYVRANGQYRAPDGGGNMTGITATVEGDTITFTGSGIQGSNSQNLPGYGVDANGSFIMTNYSTMNAYVNGDGIIYGSGVTTVDSVDFICHVSATVDDGATFSIYDQRNGAHITNVELTNTKVNYTVVDGYKDLYRVASVSTDIAFDSTVSETTTSHEGTITFASVVVPYEVTGELSQHLNPGEIAIMNAIPFMIIAALVVMAAGALYLKRED